MTSARQRRAGFTLIEVVLSLAILVFLIGSVFRTVETTLSATANLTQAQHTRQQVYGFFELCRENFLSLNASSSVVWAAESVGGKTYGEIRIREAPAIFSWGSQAETTGETALCIHTGADGSATLGVELRSIDPLTGSTESNPRWLPLLASLERITWKFYDNRTAQWQDDWLDTSRHPLLINLSLKFIGQSHLWSQTFFLPPLVQPPAAQAPPGAGPGTGATPQLGSAPPSSALPGGTQ